MFLSKANPIIYILLLLITNIPCFASEQRKSSTQELQALFNPQDIKQSNSLNGPVVKLSAVGEILADKDSTIQRLTSEKALLERTLQKRTSNNGSIIELVEPSPIARYPKRQIPYAEVIRITRENPEMPEEDLNRLIKKSAFRAFPESPRASEGFTNIPFEMSASSTTIQEELEQSNNSNSHVSSEDSSQDTLNKDQQSLKKSNPLELDLQDLPLNQLAQTPNAYSKTQSPATTPLDTQSNADRSTLHSPISDQTPIQITQSTRKVYFTLPITPTAVRSTLATVAVITSVACAIKYRSQLLSAIQQLQSQAKVPLEKQ